jgi:hypothetical protein
MQFTDALETELIEPGRSYPIWSPESAFKAANVFVEALEHEECAALPVQTFHPARQDAVGATSNNSKCKEPSHEPRISRIES